MSGQEFEKAMSKKEVKGLGDRLDVRNDAKVLVCDPGRVTVLWREKGKWAK